MPKLEPDTITSIPWEKLPKDATPYQKEVFDRVYRIMLPNQGFFLHPAAKELPDHEWRTICWNAAYTALAMMDGRGLSVED